MESIDMAALKGNEYMLFYEMMVQALETTNVVKGVDRSLYLLKEYLSSGDVVLYKKNKDGIYSYDVRDLSMTNSIEPIINIVNKTSQLVEKKGLFKLDLDLSDNFKNIVLLNLQSDDNDYILSVNNFDFQKKLDDDFWMRLKEAMQVTLKRAESYERNIKAVNTDLLTDLNNRNSYEKDIQKLSSKGDLVYGLFDLFRLKYINDNYGHGTGDIYIKEIAKILSKHWPKYDTEEIDGEMKNVDSGHRIYRIGGDEFVLITNKEVIRLAEIKAMVAAEEASIIDLGHELDSPIGLNYGIVTCENGIKRAYYEADEIMSKDKRNMYVKHGLERRR